MTEPKEAESQQTQPTQQAAESLAKSATQRSLTGSGHKELPANANLMADFEPAGGQELPSQASAQATQPAQPTNDD
jgi:hypothetical protein